MYIWYPKEEQNGSNKGTKNNFGAYLNLGKSSGSSLDIQHLLFNETYILVSWDSNVNGMEQDIFKKLE